MSVCFFPRIITVHVIVSAVLHQSSFFFFFLRKRDKAPSEEMSELPAGDGHTQQAGNDVGTVTEKGKEHFSEGGSVNQECKGSRCSSENTGPSFPDRINKVNLKIFALIAIKETGLKWER